MDEPTLTLWKQSIPTEATAEDSIRSPHHSFPSSEKTALHRRVLHLDTDNQPVAEPDFELKEKLGSGGMGVVYSAHQSALNRSVAIKMVHPARNGSSSAADALMAEAVVTGRLEHPNVVPVYDLGVDLEGNLFYAMKEVQGFPWSVAMPEKTRDENLEILLRVADTISFAHSRGVLHRDLKPYNIMLGEFGEVMVMDWGASCAINVSGHADMLGVESACCGTPAYMAPEMAKGDTSRLGETSDVYLLGAMLYQIITGRPPRREKDPVLCISLAAENHIDPAEEDGELLHIALKAMAAAPTDRYPDVKTFQQALRSYRSHSESQTLLENAKVHFHRAQQDQDYDLFSRAIYGFREARQLWPDNPEAERLCIKATLEYARCAYGRNDLELAQSLLDPDHPVHRDMLDVITKAISDRDTHQRRNRQLIITARLLGGLLLLFFAAAFFIIRAQQQETLRQRAKALKEHRSSLVSLISAHYGEQNYDAVMDTFWDLYDEYGIKGLDQDVLLKVRKAAFMNPFRGMADIQLKDPLAVIRCVASQSNFVWVVGRHEAVKVEMDFSGRYAEGSQISMHDFSFGREALSIRTSRRVRLPVELAHASAFHEAENGSLWIGAGSEVYTKKPDVVEWELVLRVSDLEFPDLPSEYDLDQAVRQEALDWMHSTGRHLPISGILLNRDGNHLAVSLGGSLVAWVDVAEGAALGWFSSHLIEFGGEEAGVSPIMQFSPDGRHLIFRDGIASQPRIFVYETNPFKYRAYYYGRDYQIRDVVCPYNTRFFAIHQDGLVYAPSIGNAANFDPPMRDDTSLWFPEKWETRRLSLWNGELAAFNSNGMRCMLLTADHELFAGSSVEGAGYDFSAKIVDRSYRSSLLMDSGQVLLLTKEGMLCAFDVNHLASCSLKLPGRVLDLCPANEANRLLVLLENDDGTRDVCEIDSIHTDRPGFRRRFADVELRSIECDPMGRFIAGMINQSNYMVIDRSTGAEIKRFASRVMPSDMGRFTQDGRFFTVGGGWSYGAMAFQLPAWDEAFVHAAEGITAFGIVPSSNGHVLGFGRRWNITGHAWNPAGNVFSTNAVWSFRSEGTALSIIPYTDRRTMEPRFWLRSWFDRFRSHAADDPVATPQPQDYWFKQGLNNPEFEEDCKMVALPKVNRQMELVLKSDLFPLCDSRLFGNEVESIAFTRDGAGLAIKDRDGIKIFNLSGELLVHPLMESNCRYVSMEGRGIWPYSTMETGSPDIQRMIETASSGDTVLIAEGTYLLKKELRIEGKRDIVIRGMSGPEKTRIVQTGDSGILRIDQSSGTAIVENLTIQGARKRIGGGGFWFRECADVRINNCHVIDCEASRGGGLYYTPATDEPGRLEIRNSIFSNNVARSSLGGAILAGGRQYQSFSLKIEDCLFSHNDSLHSGGAIRLEMTGQSEGISLRNCVFDNNSTVQYILRFLLHPLPCSG